MDKDYTKMIENESNSVEGNETGFTFDEILQLIDKISDSEIDEFRINTELATIELRKNRRLFIDKTKDGAASYYSNQSAPEPDYDTTGISPVTATFSKGEKPNRQVINNITPQNLENVYVVKSPIVGTFYASKEEGGEPLVKVGDSVKKDSVVAIVEAMKLMNEITAGAEGVVSEILVENGQLVEYDQEIMKIKL